ncbi:MAG: double-strand break repair helicase AddA [Pseudomonadota bacterium]|nr:double-strand break repair helicase AddA [Pseudomonadota bacterium]
MTEARAIPDDTRRAQDLASDPAVSAWVSANAGSGKTFVLARRVIRLLLAGVAPARILCLTFTKAAAAEMSNRIFEILGKWVTCDPEALEALLNEVLNRPPEPGEMARARTLFALALDTPGGLKIQTIHAFCEALLHQFPLEANVPGHFEVVEERRQAELLESARLAVLRRMERGGEGATGLRDAFDHLVDQASDAAIDKALHEIIAARFAFSDWVGGDIDAAMAPLWQRYGFSPGASEATVIAGFLQHSPVTREALAGLADSAMRTGGATNANFAERAIGHLEAKSVDDLFRSRNKLLLTDKLQARKQWVTKQVAADHPGTAKLLDRAAAQAEEDISRLRLFRALLASVSLFRFADEILSRYDQNKRNEGLVDFSDLIARAGNLLNRADIRDWVRYKLDRGIDHVLIDEAQDTSPEQWSIVNAITEEFFAGEGTARLPRTVFAVGDEKQSIFSFQGAAPEQFSAQANRTERRARAAGLTFAPVRLRLSFRSSPDILGAVDAVFSDPENARGLGADKGGTVHDAIRMNAPGDVRIWPVNARAPTEEKTEWLAPIDSPSPGDPAVELARRIATTIGGWLAAGEKLPGRNGPIRHGDILVLVRKRDRFMTAVIRELKQAGLNIAGADRLKLTEHVAIEDLMALGRVMVLPEDDLALAGVLKSPLFGLDDDDLIELCRRAEGVALFDHLQRLGEGHGETAELARTIHRRLERLSRLAGTAGTHEFYAHVLGREGGRRAFAARLGSEAEDVLDAFEQSALEHDRQGGNGLEAFLAELAHASPEIKREVDVRRDEIRVITVHAAKGLEAPIVFLVDPCSPAFIAQHTPSVIRMPSQDGKQAWLWVDGARDSASDIEDRLAEIRNAAEEEYRRLLYVAMTRAADRLIVCGYRGVREPREDHWHAMVSRALTGDARVVSDADGDIAEWVWQSPIRAVHPPTRASAPSAIDQTAEIREPDLPEWLWRDAAPEKARARALNPSAALADAGAPKTAAPAEPDSLENRAEHRRMAMERGTAIHRLLHLLPEQEASVREDGAMAWLERHYKGWEAASRREVLAEALGVLENPGLAMLFGPGSRSEVGLAGTVNLAERNVPVSGQIDRLLVGEDEILIADFKTNRTVPERPDRADPSYRRQLALYRALLREIYPGRPVRCMLVWTRNGAVHEFDQAQMDAELAMITPA